jgi:hypothetical protein
MPVTLTAPPYLFFASVAACAAFGLWGWYSYRRSGLSMFAVLRFFLAALAGPLWFWQLANSAVHLDKTTISWTTGFPWAPEPHSVDLAGVRHVLATEVGKGRNRGEAWVFFYQDGTKQEVRLTDLWKANREDIADHFSPMGVQLPR